MRFADIPGHEEAKERMRGMVASGKVPHAIMIEGPTGIGKLSLARAFAQYIHCEHPTADGDSCGKCQSCILHGKMNHIDTSYVFPVVKLDGMKEPPVSDDFRSAWTEYLDGRIYQDLNAWTATFGKKNARPMTYVSESRELIKKLSYTSHISQQKIVVWWLPERMNEEASDKILKLIEEPYDDTIFIMACDEPRQLLPTIYSRVQRIALRRLSDNIVANYLTTRYAIDPALAKTLAHSAEGNMTAAIAAATGSGDETASFFEFFVSLMRMAYQRNVRELKAWGDKLAGLGREAQMRFYAYAMRLVRENFVYNFARPDINYLTPAEAQFSTRFARFIHEANVESIIDIFQKAQNDIAGNANAKIVNFDMALKLIMQIIKKRE